MNYCTSEWPGVLVVNIDPRAKLTDVQIQRVLGSVQQPPPGDFSWENEEMVAPLLVSGALEACPLAPTAGSLRSWHATCPKTPE